MTAKRIVPEHTRAAQATASDPRNSAWVSAHAGSGKTHVLSQRVIRLLLGNTDPSRILCLTYTRAAAANMSSRVFRDLSAWTLLPDAELSRRIATVDGGKPRTSGLARARTLFATALETPGGLKVQTIHAFCESLLHQFPLEANIAAHFQMLDPRMEAALVAEARRDMITGAAGGGGPELAEAFARVLEGGGEHGLDLLLGEVVAKRDKLRAFIDAAHDGAGMRTAIFKELGLDPAETEESISDEAWPLPGFDAEAHNAFVVAAERSSAAQALKNIIPATSAGFAESDPVRRLELLAKGFLKSGGGAYDPAKPPFTKALHQAMPDLGQRYLKASDAIIATRERLAQLRMAEGTCAALLIADRLIARYEMLKASRGFLDFNDLINRTRRLLSRTDANAWVQYKLDQGIDHILIDEAQDTSPDQWEVVSALTDDFFSGVGGRGELNRTVFAVGDEKQSIYSFQGASPLAFDHYGLAFKQMVDKAGKPFERVELQQSFRSTRDVLEAVDSVFDLDDYREGVARDRFTHGTNRLNEPGYVEVWPYVGAKQVQEPEDWRQSIDHAKAPAALVAEQVASTIRRWVSERELLERDEPRPVRPGDIMILVRKRDRFVHALSRSLKARNIAVAGADRLILASHIAVKDLMALGRFLLQPQDDLSLAAVLKSPLFGLTEDALFRLAADRPDKLSLGEWMRKKAGGEKQLADAVSLLDRWSTDAAFRPAFEFYAGVLCDGGSLSNRRRFIERLGHEAAEILDEFLSFCLAEENVGLPGLENLLTTLETASPEIKREMDQHRDEVRILTVHASKGLEAPIVFLVDSGGPPAIDAHIPKLIPFRPRSDDMRSVEGFLWRSSKEVSNQRSKSIETELKRLADEEYRRLLYVGMTRAEDRLIVCGYYNIRRSKERTWMTMVQNALGGAEASEPFDHPIRDAEEDAFRYRVTPVGRARAPKYKTPLTGDLPIPPPELTTPLPPVERLPRPLSPSHAALLVDDVADPIASTRSPVLDATRSPLAIARGLAVHKMLQMLPDIDPAERRAAAERYLLRHAAGWAEKDREAALASVDAILCHAEFAPIFAPGSRAEVALAGTLMLRGRKRVVSGQIDRLAVADDTVMIIDYKTDRIPPASAGEAPHSYVLQLALYVELLRPLYPSRAIRAGLLYTQGPTLIELPDQMLSAALARLTQA